MGWTFDALQNAPTSVHQIIQMAASRVSSVWKDGSSAMTKSSPEKRKYAVIDAPAYRLLSDVDKQIYLPATFQFGTDESAQSGLLVGTLIWHYRIRFFNPNAVMTDTFISLMDPVNDD